jgi:sodium/potassium/calcium exchanger 6
MDSPSARERTPIRRRQPGRAFILVILAVLSITLCVSFLELVGYKSGKQHYSAAELSLLSEDNLEVGQSPILRLRGSLTDKHLQCRLVRQAKDKCAFVQKNCFDEEAGLISYLTLFYCRLPNAQPVAFAIVLVWLALLFTTIGIAASDFFCVNLSSIAKVLGMSESLTGVTFLAFGNGSPDVFSTFAAMNSNSGSLAIGELIGAAGFITAVVAGSMAIVRPFKVARRSFVRDVCFFIVSIIFACAFLADGVLHAWECGVMVGLYVFYVVFVVTWHWWLQRRRRQREAEVRVRAHFVVTGAEEEDAHLIDLEDEETRGMGTRSNSGLSDDVSALERSQRTLMLTEQEEEEDEEEQQELGLAALNRNMRVKRRPSGPRKASTTQIRPSLVGALEFRAVLSSLQKSSTLQVRPIHLRRYSDDPTYAAGENRDSSGPRADSTHDLSAADARIMGLHSQGTWPLDNPAKGRIRAVSVNDASHVNVNDNLAQSIERGRPPLDLETEVASSASKPSDLLFPPSGEVNKASQPQKGDPRHRSQSPKFLAPPSVHTMPLESNTANLSTTSVVRSKGPALKTRSSTLRTPHSIPEEIYPFPPYRDDPSHPAPSETSSTGQNRVASDSIDSLTAETPFDTEFNFDEHRRRLRWWPYIVLPSPELLFATLFPTLYGWREKSWWEKLIGLISAPSVFLLSVTLPVVELDDDGAGKIEISNSAQPTPALGYTPGSHSHSRLVSESPSFDPIPPDYFAPGNLTHSGTAVSNSSLLTLPEPYLDNPGVSSHAQLAEPNPVPERTSSAGPLYSPKDWNRWLLAIQTLTAPLFVVIIIWANTAPDSPRELARLILFALLGGFIALFILLATTSATSPPAWRFMFCFAGFAVSITWISTIANEVVGVLKTLGVVLGISDAILGLTIFAVGNSLGDFVADVTVSRLGYPVMALSACFGGPMLNILLGIGVSGLYMTLNGSDSGEQPYVIEVSHSLIVSAVSLLITLVAFLVLVPLNNWRFDRKTGWLLVAIWVISTTVNVILEIVGWGGQVNIDI